LVEVPRDHPEIPVVPVVEFRLAGMICRAVFRDEDLPIHYPRDLDQERTLVAQILGLIAAAEIRDDDSVQISVVVQGPLPGPDPHGRVLLPISPAYFLQQLGILGGHPLGDPGHRLDGIPEPQHQVPPLEDPG
jgi:hypothetical protein